MFKENNFTETQNHQENKISEKRKEILDYLLQDKLLRELLHLKEEQIIKMVIFLKDVKL